MVATSAGFLSSRETGKPRKSVDLPDAVMVSEFIARAQLGSNAFGRDFDQLFMLIYRNLALA
jgi:hypothetical protein